MKDNYFTPKGKLKKKYRATIHIKYRKIDMPSILRGREQLERVIIPQLSKAIAGCMRHSEPDLKLILERWKLEATQYLYPNSNVAQRANIEASTSHVSTQQPSTINSSQDETDNDPNVSEDDEPIDQELYDMTMAVMAKYPELEGPEIAKRAAHNLEYKIPLDKV